MPSSDARVSFSYFYDEADRIDSIYLSNGFSVQFARKENGRIDFADYRSQQDRLATREFYVFDEGEISNPFARTPLKYLEPYAPYWSTAPMTLASFGLRRFTFDFVGNSANTVTQLETQQEPAVFTFEYLDRSCP